jgi:hypothetical protein
MKLPSGRSERAAWLRKSLRSRRSSSIVRPYPMAAHGQPNLPSSNKSNKWCIFPIFRFVNWAHSMRESIIMLFFQYKLKLARFLQSIWHLRKSPETQI